MTDPVNVRKGGLYPLEAALLYDGPEEAAALLALGADPTLGVSGDSMFAMACGKSDPAYAGVVKTMMDRGCSPNEVDFDMNTPLMRAADANNGAIMQVLLNYGADPSARNNYGRRARMNSGTK